MALAIDPQVLAELAPLLAAIGEVKALPVGDVESRRVNGHRRDEDITYARRLSDAGVPTELHLHPGCPHAFEGLAYVADVSRRVIGDRVRRLKML